MNLPLPKVLSPLALFSLVLVAACAADAVPFEDAPPTDPGSDAAADPRPFEFPDAAGDVGPAKADGGSCDPPDLLIILDRSESMSASVGSQGSRIDLAISAIKSITQAPTDTSVRFGLQVLPQIGGAECSTQLVVPMNLGASQPIANALTTMSPQLSYGTPIGAALQSALTTLAKVKVANRPQYLLLITDGAECCSCNTNDYDLAVAQQLAKAGIKTFVVGFGGDDDPVLLNNLACAGGTAANFPTGCTCTSAGCAVSPSVDSKTTSLYFKASDGLTLKKALASVTNQACCGCNLPN